MKPALAYVPERVRPWVIRAITPSEGFVAGLLVGYGMAMIAMGLHLGDAWAVLAGLGLFVMAYLRTRDA